MRVGNGRRGPGGNLNTTGAAAAAAQAPSPMHPGRERASGCPAVSGPLPLGSSGRPPGAAISGMMMLWFLGDSLVSDSEVIVTVRRPR